MSAAPLKCTRAYACARGQFQHDGYFVASEYIADRLTWKVKVSSSRSDKRFRGALCPVDLELTSEVFEVVGDLGGRLGCLLLGGGTKVVQHLLLVEELVHDLPPLSLRAHEVEGRVVPVLDHQVAGLDFARARVVL